MAQFQNAIANTVNLNVFTDHASLARIPADHDVDAINLITIFNTHASHVQAEGTQFLDKNKNPVDGVMIRMTMGTIHTATCSLKGIANLSNDLRVRMVKFSQLVFPARQP